MVFKATMRTLTVVISRDIVLFSRNFWVAMATDQLIDQLFPGENDVIHQLGARETGKGDPSNG